jgi:hypothetical protein
MWSPNALINRTTSIRALQALNARRKGHTLQDIADRWGVSRERARQLSVLGQLIEEERASDDPWYELSKRTRNALVQDGCQPNLAGVLRNYHKVRDLKLIPNMGIKSIIELQKWLERHATYTLP